MVYLKVSEIAEKWNLSQRRVQDLCRLQMIPGAQRWGRDWMIPADAKRPPDGRTKSQKEAPGSHPALIKKSPFLTMTELYNTPGTADACIAAMAQHPESQALFRAQIAYSRGQIDAVYSHARDFLDKSVQESLSVREREVARLAAFGLTNQEIAKQLSVSAHTVRSLLDSARDKIGTDRRMDLALYI